MLRCNYWRAFAHAPPQHMAVIACVSSPASSSGCLHAVSISCYNNTLWMGASNCSLWRLELPAVDEVDLSRDSLADMPMKPMVTCELWSGMLQRLLPFLAACQVHDAASFSSVCRESHHDHAVVGISIRGSISGSSGSHIVRQWLHVPLEHW